MSFGLAWAREMVVNEPEWADADVHFREDPHLTITVFCHPRRYEWDIKEKLRLNGTVFLHWQTGDEFRRHLREERLLDR